MRLIKAEVVAHVDAKGNRFGIYSMDIQPNGNRLATGGGDFCIKLWNLDSLLNKPEYAKEALLATIVSHEMSVNVVRWSKDGKFLASGSDDKSIAIHKYTPNAISNQTYGGPSRAAKNKETWSRCYTLQGHAMDILDLDWLAGPTENGYTLASASVDNTIIVWHVLPAGSNSHTNSIAPSYATKSTSAIVSPRQILHGHTSYVRGLAYDPIGRYLISSGSDNRIIVWDVENEYAVVKVLEEPLRNSPDQGIYRRISWSPDGQSVCVTAATKSTKPVGMVLKRGTWESVADLVGHSSPSICTKFFNHVLQPAQALANGAHKAAPASCAVALGDQNGVVSIWSTQSNRPLYVLREVCSKMVTDIAWSSNPAHTIALFCGIDGNLTIVDFEAELGRPMQPAALEKHFQTLYGRNINEIQARPQALIESTLALKYAQTDLAPLAGLGTANTTKNLPGTANGALNHAAHAQAPLQAQAPQIVHVQQTRIVNGKKRIRPEVLQNNLDSPDEVTSASLAGPSLAPTQLQAPVQTQGQGHPSTSSTHVAGLPRVSSVASSGQNSTDFGYSGDFNDDFADPGASLMAKRMRPEGGVVVQNGAMAAFNRNGGNIASVPSSSNGMLNRPITPNGHVLPRGSAGTGAGVGGAVVMAPPAVERYMTIRFENDEVVCTVPLLGSHQRIQRFVKTPAPSTTTASTSTYSTSARGAGLGSAFVLDPSIYSNNQEKHTSGSAPSLVVTAARLTKPSVLAQLKHSGGSLSSVTLSALQDTSTVRYEVERGSVGHWTAIVAGEVTCLAATEAPHCTSASHSANSASGASSANTSFLSSPQEGLVLAGCSDGTVHCLGLGCGVRFAAPMVLGAAVSYLDLQHLPHSSTTSAGGSSSVYLALAVTADGELWKWEVDITTAKFRCIVRTNLRPALLSMKCRHGASSFDKQNTSVSTSSTTSTSSALTAASNKNGKNVRIGTDTTAAAAAVPKRAAPVSIRVEQCLLSDTGAIQVHLLSMQGGAAEGGDWQAFAYDADAMVWTRLADMRYVLSSLFAVKTIGAGATTAPTFSSDSTSHPAAPDASLTSLSTLQSLAATGAKFTAKDIIGIASAKQAVKFGLNSGSTSGSDVSAGTVQAITESVSGGGVGSGGVEVKLAPNAEDWSNLVTIGHVEDRLSVALSVGDAAEIRSWLTAWVSTCCKNGLTGRLQWLARKLITQHLSTTSNTSTTTTTNSAAAHSLSDWLLHLPKPLEVLQTVVLPVIAQNPKVHSLLADINQTLELLNLG